MLPAAPDLDHLTAAISHATAPAFMLGAVAGFLSVLVSRMERIHDRIRTLRANAVEGVPDETSAALSRRFAHLNRAIYFAVLSGLCTAALLIVAFACALLGISHTTGVALMFIIALILLMSSLVELTREVRMSLRTMHLD
jgi:hypothetical protein